MRVVLIATVLLPAFLIGKAWAGGACFTSKDDAAKDAPQTATQQKYNSLAKKIRWL